jgi:hypothetical protein
VSPHHPLRRELLPGEAWGFSLRDNSISALFYHKQKYKKPNIGSMLYVSNLELAKMMFRKVQTALTVTQGFSWVAKRRRGIE